MLNLTPSEKKTIYITLFVISIAALVQYIKSGVHQPADYDYSVMDSVFEERSYQNPDSLINKIKKSKASNYSKKTKKSEKKVQIVDINTATAAELEKLPYIGPVIANRIIKYRSAHNGFNSIQDLIKVKGIGEKTLQRIKPYITLN